MEIGKEIKVGTMGRQPLPISNPTVAPEHIILRRLAKDSYQIEDLDSPKGVFVFGIRVKRKTIKSNTPFMLGSYTTSVDKLMHDPRKVNLGDVWKQYEKEKAKWDRYSQLVNSTRMIVPMLSTAVAMFVGNEDNNMKLVISVVVLVVTSLLTIWATERLNKNKNQKIAELNARLQRTYLCPHCQRFLGFTPYSVLKQSMYCPHQGCGVPLP